tara:strand:- start:1274 stop:1975 length:702 start_codon:yes stop_codon:yes gene_type:complete
METDQLVQELFQKQLLINKRLNSISEEDVLKLGWLDYAMYHTLIGKAVADKMVEKYVAYQLGINTKANVNSNLASSLADNGDLVNGDDLIPGENNIELKICINEAGNVYARQLHLHEKIKYFLIFGGWHDTDYFMFLLTLEELVAFFEYRISINREPFGSSQGTGGKIGQAKGNPMGKMKILHEVIRGEDTTQKISFDYNSKTASDQHSYMVKNHAYTFEELKEKLKKERMDI